MAYVMLFIIIKKYYVAYETLKNDSSYGETNEPGYISGIILLLDYLALF